MIQAVEVPCGVMEVHPQIIAKTPVLRMVVILGIKHVANGIMDNAFLESKVI